MIKSTTAISLVLVGTALALNGCSSHRDEDDERNGNGTSHNRSHVGGIGYFGRGGTASRGTSHAGASSRGGFGATGGHASGGHAVGG